MKRFIVVGALICSVIAVFALDHVNTTYTAVSGQTITAEGQNRNRDTLRNGINRVIDTLNEAYVRWTAFVDHDSTLGSMRWMDIDTIPHADTINVRALKAAKIDSVYAARGIKATNANVTKADSTGIILGDTAFFRRMIKATGFDGSISGGSAVFTGTVKADSLYILRGAKIDSSVSVGKRLSVASSASVDSIYSTKGIRSGASLYSAGNLSLAGSISGATTGAFSSHVGVDTLTSTKGIQVRSIRLLADYWDDSVFTIRNQANTGLPVIINHTGDKQAGAIYLYNNDDTYATPLVRMTARLATPNYWMNTYNGFGTSNPTEMVTIKGNLSDTGWMKATGNITSGDSLKAKRVRADSGMYAGGIAGSAHPGGFHTTGWVTCSTAVIWGDLAGTTLYGDAISFQDSLTAPTGYLNVSAVKADTLYARDRAVLDTVVADSIYATAFGAIAADDVTSINGFSTDAGSIFTQDGDITTLNGTLNGSKAVIDSLTVNNYTSISGDVTYDSIRVTKALRSDSAVVATKLLRGYQTTTEYLTTVYTGTFDSIYAATAIKTAGRIRTDSIYATGGILGQSLYAIGADITGTVQAATVSASSKVTSDSGYFTNAVKTNRVRADAVLIGGDSVHTGETTISVYLLSGTTDTLDAGSGYFTRIGENFVAIRLPSLSGTSSTNDVLNVAFPVNAFLSQTANLYQPCRYTIPAGTRTGWFNTASPLLWAVETNEGVAVPTSSSGTYATDATTMVIGLQ